MKKTHIVSLIVIAACIGLIISFSADYTTYENFETAALKSNKQFHVVGNLVKDKELYYDPMKDANYFAFFMTDNEGNERKVVYRGTKPQDFERSEQIVVTGKMKEDEFVASRILMKCPSKYVDDEIELIEVTASS